MFFSPFNFWCLNRFQNAWLWHLWQEGVLNSISYHEYVKEMFLFEVVCLDYTSMHPCLLWLATDKTNIPSCHLNSRVSNRPKHAYSTANRGWNFRNSNSACSIADLLPYFIVWIFSTELHSLKTSVIFFLNVKNVVWKLQAMMQVRSPCKNKVEGKIV